VAFDDLSEVGLDSQTDSETGEVNWQIQAKTTRGKAIPLSICTQDRSKSEALAQRLRAALFAAAWTSDAGNAEPVPDTSVIEGVK
jgi:hypothetical protein